MPHAGGQYYYLREAFGPLWGFLFGWTMFMVIQTGTIAAVAVVFAKYAGVFLPWISERRYLVGGGRIEELTANMGLLGPEVAATGLARDCDLNLDGSVALDDFALFAQCFTGPGGPGPVPDDCNR